MQNESLRRVQHRRRTHEKHSFAFSEKKMRHRTSLPSNVSEERPQELNYFHLVERECASLSAEHKLMIAVLTRALSDALKPITIFNASGRVKMRHRENALAFFACESEEPFSFRWLCEHVSVDPEGLRERILALVQADNREQLFAQLFPTSRRWMMFLKNMH